MAAAGIDQPVRHRRAFDHRARGHPAPVADDLAPHSPNRGRRGRRAPGRARHHRQSRISPTGSPAACAGSRPTIPILDYVSPSVWAWRPGRARAMRAYVDQVLAILPFEPAVHVQARRAALPLCRPSADRAPRRAAPQCRRGAAPQRRSAGRPGVARQPHERDPAPCSASSAPRSRRLPRAAGRWIWSCRRFRT